MAQINMNGYNGASDILYKDDAGVAVTPVSLRVKDRIYPVEDIDRFAISRISANRLPAAFLTFLGIAVAGSSQWNTARAYIADYVPTVSYNGINMSGVDLVLWTGATLAGVGLVMLLFKQSSFVLSIVSGAETMDVLIHRRKKYLTRIAKALEVALKRRDRKTLKVEKPAPQSDQDYFKESTRTFG